VVGLGRKHIFSRYSQYDQDMYDGVVDVTNNWREDSKLIPKISINAYLFA